MVMPNLEWRPRSTGWWRSGPRSNQRRARSRWPAPAPRRRRRRPPAQPPAAAPTACGRSRARSAEPPLHVVGGARVIGIGEDHLGRPELHDPPRLALVDVEKGALLRDPLRLLHVVGH